MAAENGLKAERDRINGLVEQLKGFNPGTPEYKKLEADSGQSPGRIQCEWSASEERLHGP